MSASRSLRPAWTCLLSCSTTPRVQVVSSTARSILRPKGAQLSTISTSCRSILHTPSIPIANHIKSRIRRSTVLSCLQVRGFASTNLVRKEIKKPVIPAPAPAKQEAIEIRKDELPEEHHESEHKLEEHHDEEHHLDEFGRSEKANKAAQINLSARLKKDPGSNSSFSGFKDIWRLLKIAKPEAKWLAAAFLFLLVSSAISLSIPFSIGKILDVATQDTPGQIFGLQMNQFYAVLGVVLAIGAMANYGRIITLRIVGERIVSRLRSQLFRRTYTQDAEFFDANRVGDLISRLSSDTIIVGKSVTQNISDGLRALVTGGAGLVMMGYTSLSLTGIMSLMIPPIAVGAFFYGRNIRNLSRKIQRAIGSATKVAEERLSNVRTSQAFAGERLEVGRYNTEVRNIFKLGVREALVSATFFSTTGLAGNATILAILVFGSQQVQSGAISIGQLTSFLMYTAYAGSSLFGLSSFYSELMKGVGAASRLFELQDRTPALSATKGQKVKSAKGVIKFQDVGFSYPTRPAVAIFDGLNFSIPQGTNVAVVGNSGGGKSTISSLLLRFYSPTSGQILIDNVDLATMNVKSLRRRIGVVAQEPVLFSGSIADNISYGKPQATRQEIISAAKRANCDFIGDFPDGLDTNVGARGLMLSGGQRQRIAIARALVKDPDILILDEATSALDAESETLVNEALNKLMQGAATTISIAHRLSTIKRSDYIIVLGNNGKVAEQGTFKELSNRQGAFRKLMESQLGARPDLQTNSNVPDNFPELSEKEALEEEMDREEEEVEIETRRQEGEAIARTK